MRFSSRWVAGPLLALALALLPIDSGATTAVLLSREQLVKRSDLVVRVTAADAASSWNAEGTAIVTHTRLLVRGFLKGSGPGELLLRQLGGTVGDRTLVLPGDAHLASGEEAVLFLRRGDGGLVYLTALAQSAYHVKGDKVQRDLSGLHLVQRVKGKLLPVSGAEPRESLTKLLSDVLRLARTR